MLQGNDLSPGGTRCVRSFKLARKGFGLYPSFVAFAPAVSRGDSIVSSGWFADYCSPDFFLQGGDFTHGTGVGGESIFSSGVFEDESFEVNHNRPYMLTMSNCGERDCNGSQFLVTLAKTQWLNGKHVAFGVVLEGQDVARKVEEVGTYGGKPKSTVTIVNCGEEPLKPEDKETHY